ncbi:MAG TPA: MarR family transcriptional regulator [Patescibacteria group bacterium]|nr:MarR family transcriptional regulator [Patescibacteria group bacterium]
MGTVPRAKRLGAVFLALKRALHERLQRSTSFDSASLARVAVLDLVRRNGETTMKDVAAYLCVTPPSATALADGAVAAGLLTRRQDPDDRRSVRLRLTPKGKRALASGMRGVEAAMSRMFARLDAQEQDRLIALLEKILL